MSKERLQDRACADIRAAIDVLDQAEFEARMYKLTFQNAQRFRELASKLGQARHSLFTAMETLDNLYLILRDEALHASTVDGATAGKPLVP